MIDFIEGIYKLNPSIVTIRGEEAFDADDNKVEYDKTLVEAYVANKQIEADAKAAAKESALTKLQALGLTEEEIKALIGGI